MDEAKQEASMDGWLILQRARATGYMVISKEDLAVMAADPVTCLEPVMLFFSDRGLGRLKTSAREAIDQLRLKVFRCEVLADDDVPPGVPIARVTKAQEQARSRLRGLGHASTCIWDYRLMTESYRIVATLPSGRGGLVREARRHGTMWRRCRDTLRPTQAPANT